MKISAKKLPTLFVLAFTLLSTFLASCQGPTTSSDGNVTLNLQHGWNKATPAGALFQELLSEFKRENPTISFAETITSGEENTQVYETAFLAGEAPDIVFINLVDKSTLWLEQGATIDVTQLMEEWGLKDRVLPAALEEWTNGQGQVQGFPFDGFKWPMWYNTAELRKVGINEVPTTIDGLIDAADKLRDAGSAPIAIGGNDWSGNKLFIQIMASYLTDEAAEPLYRNGNYCANADAKKGIELFVKLRDAGVFVDSVAGIDADQTYSLFYTSKAVGMSAGSWAIAGTPEEMLDDVYLGGFPLPADSVHEKPTAYQGYTSTGMWISPNGEQKLDAVRKFIEFMYKPETVNQFIEQTDMTPALKVEHGPEAVSPLLDQATTQLDERVDYVLLPDLYVPGDVLAELQRATSLAFTDGQSVDQICSALQGAYN